MQHNIVQYHNDFNDYSLKNFTPHEMDFLMALLCFVRKQSNADNAIDKEIQISFTTLKKIINYKPTASNRFVNELISMNKKLMSLTLTTRSENDITQFVLFPTFYTDTKSQILSVRINPDFTYLIYQLSRNWTRFELDEFTSLRSKYAKALYRILKQFRTTGWTYLPIDRFRAILDIPDSYKSSEINKWVLTPIRDELSDIFTNFEIIPKRGSGRGRPIIAYQFEFMRETKKQTPVQTCPKCKGKLIEKQIHGKLCWCHADGYKSNAKCKLIFNSIHDIMTYDTPSKQKENYQQNNEFEQLAEGLANKYEFK